MFAQGELLDKHKTAFMMIHNYGYTFDDINTMTPFEFELHVSIIIEHNKKLEEKKRKR